MPKTRNVGTRCEGILPGCTVGSRQAEHESHRESMEEDDMVKRRAIPRVQRRTDEEDKSAASPRDLIRRCQGLAKGWPWRPPKDPLYCPPLG